MPRVKKISRRALNVKRVFIMLIHRWKEKTKVDEFGVMIELFRFIDGKEYILDASIGIKHFILKMQKKPKKL